MCMNEQKPAIDNWDDIRVAYHVARLGTLSAAASHLGVHHATVIRRIDALEAQLGTKLFQRHARGYTPTEAGDELLKMAAVTENQLTLLAGQLRGAREAIGGDLTITTVGGFSVWLTPLLAEFQVLYPDVRLTLELDYRLFKLQYGEAHLAIRPGARPKEPDNVVQSVGRYPISLFAHRDYVTRNGRLPGLDRLGKHRFIGGAKDASLSPVDRWVNANIPDEAIVFRSSDMRAQDDALMAGIGIGFAALHSGLNAELVQMSAPLPEWAADLWMVTHMDLHRTAKVQAISRFLIKRIAEIGGQAPLLRA